MFGIAEIARDGPRDPPAGHRQLAGEGECYLLVAEMVDAVDFYAPERERGVRWNDPRFAIRWPAEPQVISDKDAQRRDFDPAWNLAD